MSIDSPHPTSAASFSSEAPDKSYWTAYDHFMAEREARAMRAAYATAMLASLWRAIRARVAGTRRQGAHRRAEAH